MPEQTATQKLAGELEQELTARYGLMLASRDLWCALGFHSPAAFRQAIARGTVDVPFFAVPNRRGRFALAKEVALWIAQHRCGAVTLPVSPADETQ